MKIRHSRSRQFYLCPSPLRHFKYGSISQIKYNITVFTDHLPEHRITGHTFRFHRIARSIFQFDRTAPIIKRPVSCRIDPNDRNNTIGSRSSDLLPVVVQKKRRCSIGILDSPIQMSVRIHFHSDDRSCPILSFVSFRTVRTVCSILAIFTIGTVLAIFAIGTVLTVFTVSTILSVLPIDTVLTVFTVGTILTVFAIGTILTILTILTIFSFFTVVPFLAILDDNRTTFEKTDGIAASICKFLETGNIIT